jgi:CRP/FNR family transcriptional regulator
MPFDHAPLARPQATHTDCLVCPVRSCLARADQEMLSAAWTDSLAPRQAVMPGSAPLFRAGERPQAIYSVRGGCIKTATVDAEGNEHIRGFFLPGDLIGLDALGARQHYSTASAVIPSQVCVAPMAEMNRMLSSEPALARQIAERTSQQLAMALALSGDYTADQRLAAFLLLMEQKLPTPRGFMRLPMPQRDIGNYLRLATETVCRTLKGFTQKGWVQSEDRALRVVARETLEALAEPVGLLPVSSMPMAA